HDVSLAGASHDVGSHEPSHHEPAHHEPAHHEPAHHEPLHTAAASVVPSHDLHPVTPVVPVSVSVNETTSPALLSTESRETVSATTEHHDQAATPEPMVEVATTAELPNLTATAAPNAAPKEAPHLDIDAMLRAAGLQMTETDPERLRVVQAEQSTTAPAPRAPRERRPAAQLSDEPLQQVETRH
ncbi:MAG: hypothetical protein ACKO71_06895, partial [Betaproteobacteria bacterium]